MLCLARIASLENGEVQMVAKMLPSGLFMFRATLVTLIMLFVSVFAFNMVSAQLAGYAYRTSIWLTNTSGSEYTGRFIYDDLNGSYLVELGYIQSDGDDIAVVYEGLPLDL